MSDGWNNPWKLTAIGMGLVMVTALVTGVVMGGFPSRSDDKISAEVKAPEAKPAAPAQHAVAPAQHATAPAPAASPRTEVAAAAPAPVPAPAPAASAQPPASTIESCNRMAANAPTTKDKTVEVVKDSAVAGLVGAAVGAAGGAIAGGGKGAGKGAGIGGVVGLGAGALYGLNENRKNDEHYREAYAACMRRHGYGG